MEQFRSTFEHHPQCRIVICKQCQNGIVRCQLSNHLKDHHQHFTLSIRNSIVSAAKDIPDWADKDNAIIFPTSVITSLPHLPVWQDVLKCTVSVDRNEPCNFFCRGIKNIKSHCRRQHGWLNPRVQGRNRKEQHVNQSDPWIEGVWCQKFSTHGLLARLFEVHKPNLNVQQQEDFISQDFQGKRRLLISSIAKAKQNVEETARHAIVEADTNRFIPNDWLDRAGWAKYLAGLDRDWLASLIV